MSRQAERVCQSEVEVCLVSSGKSALKIETLAALSKHAGRWQVADIRVVDRRPVVVVIERVTKIVVRPQAPKCLTCAKKQDNQANS